jgi:hypothetical protein
VPAPSSSSSSPPCRRPPPQRTVPLPLPSPSPSLLIRCTPHPLAPSVDSHRCPGDVQLSCVHWHAALQSFVLNGLAGSHWQQSHGASAHSSSNCLLLQHVSHVHAPFNCVLSPQPPQLQQPAALVPSRSCLFSSRSSADARRLPLIYTPSVAAKGWSGRWWGQRIARRCLQVGRHPPPMPSPPARVPFCVLARAKGDFN